MQALSLYNVQCMVASPAGMAEFLDYYERSPAFLCPFEVMLSVGSKLAASLSDRVRARMCSHVVHGYGATEGNPVAGGYVHQFGHIKGAIGYVTPGMIVQAVDDAGTCVKPGGEGHIRFRGDKCVNGYVGNPPGSEKYFRDGWFYPGDIGAVTEDGVLIISGRSKTIIDLGGDKINPEVIEAVLMSYPAWFMPSPSARQCARNRGGLGRARNTRRRSIRRPFALIARRSSAARWCRRGCSGCLRCRAMSATRSTAMRSEGFWIRPDSIEESVVRWLTAVFGPQSGCTVLSAGLLHFRSRYTGLACP